MWHVVDAVFFKFVEVFFHSLGQLVGVVLADLLVAHVAAGQLLSQNIIEHRVLIVRDGLVDAALLKGAGRVDVPFPELAQRVHAVLRAQREELFLQLVVYLKAILLPAGIEDPVADIYHVQKAAEFLLRQFDLHSPPLL